jgi:hypothetical protein
MAETLVVVAFDELYTLVLEPDIVTIRGQNPIGGMPHSAIEIYGNPVEAVNFLADPVTGGSSYRRSLFSNRGRATRLLLRQR